MGTGAQRAKNAETTKLTKTTKIFVRFVSFVVRSALRAPHASEKKTWVPAFAGMSGVRGKGRPHRPYAIPGKPGDGFASG
jgi:hypothetical protein